MIGKQFIFLSIHTFAMQSYALDNVMDIIFAE